MAKKIVLAQLQKKIQDLSNELESKKSESLNTPWYKFFTRIKNYTERANLRSAIAEQKGLIAKLAASMMHTKYHPDKDSEKQKTAHSLLKNGEDLFKIFYDKGFEIYKERVANEKAGGPSKTMTPEEKLIASTRDLIGAALSHLKYPSNLTRETLERRHAAYNEALQNTNLSKDDDVLPKLNEFLLGVKSLDPKIDLPTIENKETPIASMTAAPFEALITRLAILVKNGKGNTRPEPVKSKSALFLTDSEKIKQEHKATKSNAKNEPDSPQSDSVYTSHEDKTTLRL